MIKFQFDFPSPSSVKDKLSAGYRSKRNYLILELFTALVQHTPVKTGLARGNMRIGIGRPETGQISRTDPEGFTVVEEELGKLKGVSPFAKVFINNTVPYFDQLESGSSGQAPEGVFIVVVPAWRSIHGKDVL